MTSIVMTVPPGLAGEFDTELPGIARTATTFHDLFASARKSLKVVAPYVDPTFSALIAATRAPVQVVTTPSPGRPPRPNPVLERCTAMCGTVVRYVNERRDRALIFQMHSKLLIADGKRAYVGSANLTDTATNYNAELGVLLDERSVVTRLRRIFDYFFDKVAVRADDL